MNSCNNHNSPLSFFLWFHNNGAINCKCAQLLWPLKCQPIRHFVSENLNTIHNKQIYICIKTKPLNIIVLFTKENNFFIEIIHVQNLCYAIFITGDLCEQKTWMESLKSVLFEQFVKTYDKILLNLKFLRNMLLLKFT